MGQRAILFFFFLLVTIPKVRCHKREKICELLSWMSVCCGQRRPQLPTLSHPTLNFIVTNETPSFVRQNYCQWLCFWENCQMWWNFQIFTVLELTEKKRFEKDSESSLTSHCKLEGCRVSVIVFHKGAEDIQERMVVWKSGWRSWWWTAVWLLLISLARCQTNCDSEGTGRDLCIWNGIQRCKCRGGRGWHSWHLPEVSGQVPCMRPNMLPQALLTAAILARTGRLWITKDTSFRCCLARFCACPRIPNPVMSVAACALKVCMSPAATWERRGKNTKSEKIELSGKCFNDIVHSPNEVAHL